MDLGAANGLIERYLQRESLTQSLPYAAILQARGFATPLAGSAIVMLQPRDDGVIARMQRPRQLDLGLVSRFIAQVRPVRVLIEPAASGTLVDEEGNHVPWRFDPARSAAFEELFASRGWRTTSAAYSHTKTRIVDLAPGLDAVLAQMSTAARRNTRAATRGGLRCEALRFGDVDDAALDELHRLYDAFLSTRPEVPRDWSFRLEMMRQFRGRGYLVLAYDSSGLAGAVYMPIHDRVAHYYAAFTSDAAAPSTGAGLVLECMQLALEDGCDTFDFVGVWDERYPQRNAAWRGFTEFKRRFGGAEVWMPPSLEPVPSGES